MDSLKEEMRISKKIGNIFKARPVLGRIKTILQMSPIGNIQRYHVHCTCDRDYIVYIRDGELFNVGIYNEKEKKL